MSLPCELYHKRYLHNFSYIPVKIKLADNSINSVTNNGLSDIISLATFRNYSGSMIISSISAMITFLDSDTTKFESTNQLQTNSFLLGHIYFRRSQLTYLQQRGQSWIDRLDKASISIVIGTKLSDKLFDFKDIYFGCSFGHFMHNNIAFLVGVNMRSPYIQNPLIGY